MNNMPAQFGPSKSPHIYTLHLLPQTVILINPSARQPPPPSFSLRLPPHNSQAPSCLCNSQVASTSLPHETSRLLGLPGAGRGLQGVICAVSRRHPRHHHGLHGAICASVAPSSATSLGRLPPYTLVVRSCFLLPAPISFTTPPSDGLGSARTRQVARADEPIRHG